MNKEVKKSIRKKDFYLSIYLQLKQGLYPSQIARELKCSKQKVSYYLSSLKKAGLVKKIGYGVWEVVKEFNPKEVKKSTRVATINPQKIFTSLKQDSVRGHAFQFKLQLPEDLRNWDKREQILSQLGIKFKPLNLFGGGQSIDFKGRKIHLTKKSIIIYEKESFISDLAKDSQSQAVSHFLKLIKSLERKLRANFSHFGKYRFRITRQHYALIKNALARQYNSDGEKLEVYCDKGLWFLIDNSFNLHEAETVHPKSSVEDNEKVQNFFNSLKQAPITTNEIYNNFSEIKNMMKESSRNQMMLSQVIGQLDKNLIRVTKEVMKNGN